MTTFTPEEIKQARKEPRVGDVWNMDGETWIRTVLRVTPRKVFFASTYGGNGDIFDVTRKIWGTGASNATLINRGPA